MKFPTPPASLSRAEFVAVFGAVYEHSAWVAGQAFDRGLPPETVGVDGMFDVLHAIIEAAGHPAQLTLLRAHPDLAGKLATSGQLTADSTAEQAGAGLDQCTDAEFAEFTRLNAEYKEKFGFPFILAVKGRDRHEILSNFRTRVKNPRQTEFREALDQVHQIARLRLLAMV